MMKDTFWSVFPLLLGTVFLMLGNGMLGTLLSVRVLIGGASEIATGMMMSAYFFGLIIASLRVSTVIASVGHIRAFAVFASMYSAAVLAHGLDDGLIYWLVLRCIEGICTCGFFMCTESWLNAKSNNQVRGKILSAYMCAVYLSQGTGQFLLNMADPQSFAMLAFVSIMMSIALVPVALTKVKEPEKPSSARMPFKRLISLSPLGVFACLVSGLVAGGVYGLGPVYADRLGLDISGTATLMAVVILGGLLFQWPIGGLSDRIDRRHVIAITIVMSMLCSVVLFYAQLEYWLLMLMIGLFGGFSFSLYPLAISHTNDFIEHDDLVSASGALVLIYSIAAMISPFLGGVIMKQWGAEGFPLYFIFITILGGGFTIYRIIYGETISEEDRGAYQVVPRTSSLAVELSTDEEEPN